MALDPQTYIDDLGARNPDAVKLAALVSLASRIEPGLLRAMRLTLLGSADASAEADLWLSPLMWSRSVLFAVMRAEVADILRRSFSRDEENAALLQSAWEVLQRVHRDAPAALRAEEEITCRVLADPDDREIGRLFESVLSALNDGRDGLARWAARALPRMPQPARESASAWRVALKAASMLGGTPILSGGVTRAPISEIVPGFRADGLPKLVVGLRLFEDALRVSEPPEPHSLTIPVPTTTPLVLEVNWEQQDGRSERRIVSFVPGSTQLVRPIGASRIQITTAALDAFAIEPPAGVVEKVLALFPAREREILGRFYLHHQRIEDIRRETDVADTRFRELMQRAEIRLAELSIVQEDAPFTQVAAAGGLTARVYRGDGAVLLAFDLNDDLTRDLAGFAAARTDPDGTTTWLSNRLSAEGPGAGPVSTEHAPLQRFRWVDRCPPDIPGTCVYQVNAVHSRKGRLEKAEPGVRVSIDLPPPPRAIEAGFTRPVDSVEAARGLRLPPGELDFDTSPYRERYRMLGWSAHRMMFDFIRTCIDDPASTVEAFAFDLDHPDILRLFAALGKRLRIVLDDSDVHRKRGFDVERMLVKAGCKVLPYHFRRLSHNKIVIRLIRGAPAEVLTGSANFAINSLYAQHNHVLVLRSNAAAAIYSRYFDEAAQRKVKAYHDWQPVSDPQLPPVEVGLSPSRVLVDPVVRAIANARSSVFFSLGDFSSNAVVAALEEKRKSGGVLVGGVLHSNRGSRVLWGEADRIAPTGAPLSLGHGKFIVVDFNEPEATVFAGSAGFADKSALMNGDNVLAIHDPAIAAQFAIEALNMIDHARFRAAMGESSGELRLDSTDRWCRPYYSRQGVRYLERTLLALSPKPLSPEPRSPKPRSPKPEGKKRSTPPHKRRAR